MFFPPVSVNGLALGQHHGAQLHRLPGHQTGTGAGPGSQFVPPKSPGFCGDLLCFFVIFQDFWDFCLVIFRDFKTLFGIIRAIGGIRPEI